MKNIKEFLLKIKKDRWKCGIGKDAFPLFITYSFYDVGRQILIDDENSNIITVYYYNDLTKDIYHCRLNDIDGKYYIRNFTNEYCDEVQVASLEDYIMFLNKYNIKINKEVMKLYNIKLIKGKMDEENKYSL